MDIANHAGAAVLLAFAGILPLSVHLRRRHATGRGRGHSPRIALAGSSALLLVGLAAAGLQ